MTTDHHETDDDMLCLSCTIRDVTNLLKVILGFTVVSAVCLVYLTVLCIQIARQLP